MHLIEEIVIFHGMNHIHIIINFNQSIHRILIKYLDDEFSMDMIYDHLKSTLLQMSTKKRLQATRGINKTNFNYTMKK